MQVDAELYNAEDVVIRLVSVKPEVLEMPQHDATHKTISIPIRALRDGVEFEVLRAYLLNYAAPDQYFSLHPKNDSEVEQFLQILWPIRKRR